RASVHLDTNGKGTVYIQSAGAGRTAVDIFHAGKGFDFTAFNIFLHGDRAGKWRTVFTAADGSIDSVQVQNFNGIGSADLDVVARESAIENPGIDLALQNLLDIRAVIGQ